MALNAESKRDLVAEARHRALHTTSRVESAGLDELADALDASQKKLTRVDERLAELIRFHDHAATYEQGAYQVMHETFANELRKAIAEPSEPRCAVAGIPATDPDACGDCEPCLTPKAMIARAEALRRSEAEPSEQAACEHEWQHEWKRNFNTAICAKCSETRDWADIQASPSPDDPCIHGYADWRFYCGLCKKNGYQPALTEKPNAKIVERLLSAAPSATTGDFNNRLLRLEGIVKAIIEAVRGDHQ